MKKLQGVRNMLWCVALSAVALSMGGCGLLEPREAEEKPKVYEVPKLPVFDPKDYLTPGTPIPGNYRLVSALSGELLQIQSVAKTKKGDIEVPQYGVPETIHLAGIVTPAPGQPGWQSSVNKVNEWLRGKEDLSLEWDPKYPIDLNGRRMVQLYFNSTNKLHQGQRWNLNRMLVHTGYAVVDLVSATSIDTRQWLNDEEFAKTYVDPKTSKLKPLGLWGLGITIPQRGNVVKIGTSIVPVDSKDKKATAGTRPTLGTTVTTSSSSTAATSASPAAGPASSSTPRP